MVTVSGRLLDFVEDPSIVAQVQVRAREVRPHGDGVMLDHPVTVEWNRGTGVVSFDAAAGTAGVIVWQSVGRSRASGSLPLVVPDKATATLRECVEAVMLADAGTITELERLALEVTGMVATIQNIAQLEEWADSAKQDATTATTAAGEATEAASEAQGIATNLPATISSELDARVPPKVAAELGVQVPPAVADAIADDRAVADAAAAAVGAAADEIKWTKGVLNPTVYTLDTAPDGTVSVQYAHALAANAPIAQRGTAITYQGGGWRWQLYLTVDPVKGQSIFQRWHNGTIWSAWENLKIKALEDHGELKQANIGSLDNAPVGQGYIRTANEATALGAPSPAMSYVETFSGGTIPMQRVTNRNGIGGWEIYHRYKLDAGWTEWQPLGGQTLPEPAPVVESASNRHKMLGEEILATVGGTQFTGNAVPVAFTVDDYPKAFIDVMLPELQRLELPATLALGSRQYDPSSTAIYDGAVGTTWEQIDALPANITIAAHGATHGSASDEAGLQREIVTGLSELQAALPSKKILTFIQPSAYYGAGFNNGDSISAYADTRAGQLLLANHGYITGTRMPGGQRTSPMTGDKPAIGLTRSWWENTNGISTTKAVISACAGKKHGVILGCHAIRYGTDGRATVLEMVEFLEWLKAEQDAGRVKVMTLEQFYCARYGNL